MNFVAQLAEEDRERQAARVRAELAKDPQLSRLGDGLKAVFGPDVKLSWLKTDTYEARTKDWRDVEAFRAQEKARPKVELPPGSVWQVYRYA